MQALRHRPHDDGMPSGERHTDEIVDAVAAAPLFSEIDRSEITEILGAFDEQSFNRGHRVTPEGLRGSDFYVIARGHASVRVEGRQVADLGPGEFFGEVAVLGDGMRSATVAAETPMRCLVLSNNRLDELLVQHPRLSINLIREMVARYRDLTAWPPMTVRVVDR